MADSLCTTGDDFKLIDKCLDSPPFTSKGALEFGCCCENSCNDDDLCICLAQHRCFYDEKGILDVDEVSEPLYECNQCCECGQNCPNRVVQKGSNIKFKVTGTTNKGYGLITQEFIPKGKFVIEYIGERISKVEAANRLLDLQEQNASCYIYALLEHYGDSQQFSYFVDATKTGNLARFINHSCEPNLILVPIRVNQIEPKFSLFAAKDIVEDTELTFSYGNVDTRDGKKLKKCFCGAKCCKGFLPFSASITVK